MEMAKTDDKIPVRESLTAVRNGFVTNRFGYSEYCAGTPALCSKQGMDGLKCSSLQVLSLA